MRNCPICGGLSHLTGCYLGHCKTKIDEDRRRSQESGMELLVNDMVEAVTARPVERE